MTAMSKPNPDDVQEVAVLDRAHVDRPRVAGRHDARGGGADPGRERRATWRGRSPSRPPPGRGPRPCPERRIALPTLLQVPSPPTATIRRKPVGDGLLRRGDPRRPARVVRAWATDAPPVASTGRPGRAPTSRAAASLAGRRVEDDEDVVRRGQGAGSGGLELDPGARRSAGRPRIHCSRNGTS